MPRPPRVVVGVDESVAGLRALRAGAAQARLLLRELYAVRAFSAPPDRDQMRLAAVPGGPVLVPGPETSQSVRYAFVAREQAALDVIERVFVQAMGGRPRNLSIRAAAILGEPGPVLVGAARQDEDLLVVGAPARRRFRPFRRSVASYCTEHAACPVLVVPPPELARKVDGGDRRWRELDEFLALHQST